MSDTILKSEIIDVKGTTKLRIGDPGYFEELSSPHLSQKVRTRLKNITFNGNIMASPSGTLKISLVKDEHGYDFIDVVVVQAMWGEVLKKYLNDMYCKEKLKKKYELGCDHAEFEIQTKYGYDLFRTGGDGYYGSLYHMKTNYGMILYLGFDGDLFSYDEIKDRMLKLFPEA